MSGILDVEIYHRNELIVVLTVISVFLILTLKGMEVVGGVRPYGDGSSSCYGVSQAIS